MLWILAFVVVLGATGWQRRTGPSYPLRGSVELAGGETVRYRLARNETTVRDALVSIPEHAGIDSVTVHFRRHGTDDDFRAIPMRTSGERWEGFLPRQPAAGKLDYYLVLNGELRLPAAPSSFAVIRFKDPVPIAVLVPHILMMFLSMLCGVRAGIAVFVELSSVRRLAWVTLACLSLGGLVLGPIVQKYAFGAYWTGWPMGDDLTDTKTLVVWAGWMVAVLALGLRGPIGGRARIMVVVAVSLMVAVYLVPHSLRGSTLDYERLDEGVRAEDAIRTG